ncbi:MAG: beta-eliminating lyase-related protein [Nocardioidaceae bacterium]
MSDADQSPAAPPPTASELREQRFRELARGADRWLQMAVPGTPREAMQELVAELDERDDSDGWDTYGRSGPVEVLESEVARLLGKPAAAMFPSGIMAQQSVLRVWSDRRGSRRVALPALSHLLHYELDGPQLLHGLTYERLTEGSKMPTAADLDAIPGVLAAALLELPLRDAGYLLPTWDELTAFATACRDREVPLHLDGARLWESQPYLDHSLEEIADLADSVYVSFYKGLRGLSGAAVVGPEDIVAEARRWRQRHGGTLFRMSPYALGGLRGLRESLPLMGAFHEHAVALAAVLSERGLTVFPEPPHTNAFRIFAPVAVDDVMERLVATMESDRVMLTPPWRSADVPGWSWTEFTVGASTLEWAVDEAADLLRSVILG